VDRRRFGKIPCAVLIWGIRDLIFVQKGWVSSAKNSNLQPENLPLKFKKGRSFQQGGQTLVSPERWMGDLGEKTSPLLRRYGIERGVVSNDRGSAPHEKRNWRLHGQSLLDYTPRLRGKEENAEAGSQTWSGAMVAEAEKPGSWGGNTTPLNFAEEGALHKEFSWSKDRLFLQKTRGIRRRTKLTAIQFDK